MSRYNKSLGKIALTGLLLHSLSVFAQGEGEAASDSDLQKEKRLHQIYKKYNEEPVNENRWRQMVKSTRAKTYKIQSKDNLWEVSDTLFGDPNFWPKIWSLNNSEIFNPHEIKPKMAIQFVPGTTAEAPQVSLQSEKSLNLVSEETFTDNYWIELPEAARKKKGLTSMPKSLPNWSFGKQAQATTEYDLRPFILPHLNPDAPITYFSSEQELQRHGQVVGTELDFKSANEYQYIYVDLDDPQSSKVYTVMKVIGRIMDPYKARNAFVISVQGEVEIVDKVNESSNTYRAIVKSAVAPIQVGGDLIVGSMPRFKGEAVSEGPSVDAQVIGGNFSARRVMLSSKAFVFVNSGSEDGLKAGQRLKIYRNDRSRSEKTFTEINPRMIGDAVVVQVENRMATLYVTSGEEAIRIGDGISPDGAFRQVLPK